MKGYDLIRKLARRARREAPPRVDVSDRVMAAVYALPHNGRALTDPLAWVAAASAVAAVVVLAMASGYGDSWSDAFVASRIELPWWLL
jgi:hypothetical protein